MRYTPLSVPEEVASAVRSEALRQRCRPGEVLVDFVRQFWPRYVAEELHRDLTHPTSRWVIDAASVPPRNEQNPMVCGHEVLNDEELYPANVAISVTAGRPESMPPSDAKRR